MRILKSLIGQKLEMEEMLRINLKRGASFSEHICAYMHSLIYLKKYDSLLNNKMALWRKFITAKSDNQEGYYNKLLKFKPDEDAIIVQALNKIEEDKNKIKDTGFGALYREGTWGCTTYEFQSAE